MVWNRGNQSLPDKDLAENTIRNRAGLVTRRFFGSALRDWTYDNLGRITRDKVTSLGGGYVTPFEQDFVYGATDEAETITTAIGGLATRTLRLGYNSRHQLTHASDDQSYTFDASYSDEGRVLSAYVEAGPPSCRRALRF